MTRSQHNSPASAAGPAMTDTIGSRGGWAPAIRDDPFGHFADVRARCPVQQARLANGDVVAEGLPGPEYSRDMLNVDPPDHTRLRRLVSRAFMPSRIAALEPAIRAIARLSLATSSTTWTPPALAPPSIWSQGVRTRCPSG